MVTWIDSAFLLNALFCLKIFQVHANQCKHFCNIPSQWITQAENVCHGTKDSNYYTFKVIQDCRLVALRLTHVLGYLSGNDIVPTVKSRWGANINDCPLCLSTIILKNNKLWLPEYISEKGFYELKGFGVHDDALIFKKNFNLTAGDELQIGYGKDFINYFEENSGGFHCVNVDFSCLI